MVASGMAIPVAGTHGYLSRGSATGRPRFRAISSATNVEPLNCEDLVGAWQQSGNAKHETSLFYKNE